MPKKPVARDVQDAPPAHPADGTDPTSINAPHISVINHPDFKSQPKKRNCK